MSDKENKCPLLNLPCKEKDSYSLRDVYDELWRGRDFEISHLWQRSVFLAVFMLAIAGGYGTYMMKVMFPSGESNIEKICGTLKNEAKTHGDYRNCKKASIDIENEANQMKKAEISFKIKKLGNIEKYKKLTPIFLTYLGIIFSMMWIMMAKGSKYCFERYEFGINKILENKKFSKEDKEFNPGIADDDIPHHGNLPEPKDDDVCDYILSPLAGRYSVSKINITIGIVALLFWCCLNILHILDVAQNYIGGDLFSFSVSLIFAILTYVFIYFTLAIYCKSS
ncbi:MAG: hypothetical protein J6B11_07585 [Spirochaetales bacterium]|nr:hypothetical protein [Spirochaetales bacterium]